MTNETVQQEESFYKQIAASGPGLTAIVRARDMQIIFVNSAFEHYLGYSADDVTTGNIIFSDFFDSYQLPRFQYQLRSLDEHFDNRSHYIIYQLKGKNGQLASYYLYLSPVQEDVPEQDKKYYVLMHPDLSKWGMPFSTFQTKEIFLEQFDNEDFGTFEWIISDDKVYWSPGVYSIYEVDRSQQNLNNAFARSFIHPDDLEKVAEMSRKTTAESGEMNVEFRIITSKGNIKITHNVARFIKNQQGQAVKFIGSIRDVTHQRAIENDLKNKVEELNHSNKELEEFAYVASHDMQEPLRKITTFGSRLMEKYRGSLEGEGAMYLSRMTTAAENMRLLIKDLLDFSRIAKTEQPFEKVHLNVTVRQVKTELELVIEETGTTIVSDSLPVIDAIPSQMIQLFGNIISNAIKFHKEGVAPVIQISCRTLNEEELLTHKLPASATWYHIEVSDNGIGFEEEYASRIFNVFQRLHGKSEYPGSGIGLAICKKIIEHHSGQIFAQGIPGHGATFIFIIPASQEKITLKSI